MASDVVKSLSMEITAVDRSGPTVDAALERFKKKQLGITPDSSAELQSMRRFYAAQERESQKLRQVNRTHEEQDTRNAMADKLRQMRDETRRYNAEMSARARLFGEPEQTKPLREINRTKEEQDSRNELASKLRNIREFGKQYKAGNVSGDFETALYDSSYKGVSRGVSSALNHASDSKELKGIARMLEGGGKLIGLRLLSGIFEESTAKIAEMSDKMRTTDATAKELAGDFARSLPILGDMVKGWDNIGAAISGAHVYEKQLLDTYETVGNVLDKNLELMREQEKDKKDNQKALRTNEQNRQIDRETGYYKDLAKNRIDSENKVADIHEKAEDKIKANIAKRQEGDKKLSTREAEIRKLLSNSDMQVGNPLNTPGKRELRASLEAELENIRNLRHQSLVDGEKYAAEQRAAAEKLVADEQQRAATEEKHILVKAAEDNQQAAEAADNDAAQARIESLRQAGKNYEAEKLAIETELQQRIREIRKQNDEADAARPGEADKRATFENEKKQLAAALGVANAKMAALEEGHQKTILEIEQETASKRAEIAANTLKLQGENLKAQLMLEDDAHKQRLAKIDKAEKEALKANPELKQQITDRADAERKAEQQTTEENRRQIARKQEEKNYQQISVLNKSQQGKLELLADTGDQKAKKQLRENAVKENFVAQRKELQKIIDDQSTPVEIANAAKATLAGLGGQEKIALAKAEMDATVGPYRGGAQASESRVMSGLESSTLMGKYDPAQQLAQKQAEAIEEQRNLSKQIGELISALNSGSIRLVQPTGI